MVMILQCEVLHDYMMIMFMEYPEIIQVDPVIGTKITSAVTALLSLFTLLFSVTRLLSLCCR